jgi:hypothetical protein
MALQRKCARKARKMPNIIEKQLVPNEEQTIVIYATPPSQGML